VIAKRKGFTLRRSPKEARSKSAMMHSPGPAPSVALFVIEDDRTAFALSDLGHAADATTNTLARVLAPADE